MRASLSLLPLILLLAACTTTRGDGSGRIQTTSEAKRENLEGAVSAPLRDVNLLRTKIPPVLLEALADPYKRPPSATCASITAEIRPLNEALGDDLDEPDAEGTSVLVRGRDTALGAVASVASDIIPFRGFVRTLTGAEQHDQLVAGAITAGAVRRAYLKGLGESKGCRPPATPSHVLTGSPVPEQRDWTKPRYPVR